MKKAIAAVLAAGFLAAAVPPVFGQGADFGTYPAGFRIWEGYGPLAPDMNAFVRAGYAQSPAVRELFGPNAPFAVSMRTDSGPVTISITIESSSGSGNEFQATLLLSAHSPGRETLRVIRMQVRFRADTVAEKSYVTYFRQVNLVNNNAQEWRSSGTYLDNLAILGIFIGSMDMYWDTSRLGKRTAQANPNQIPGSNIFLDNLSRADVDTVMTGTVFDVFTRELRPNDYNTELRRTNFLRTAEGRAYQERLAEAQNRLRTQGIKTIQIQPAVRNINDSRCSISDYDVNRRGFEVTLEGGSSRSSSERTGPSINGFEIPNLEFAPDNWQDSHHNNNYWTVLFIPVPEAAAVKIERNRKVCVQLQLALDTFELQKVFLLDEETKEVYAEFSFAAGN